MALQHLRSSTANKRPLPAGMSDGQLAINTNLASPGLFFKDSNGDLVKVGPVHVGTTAPNASPASGGQTGNTLGEQWLDTTGGTYVFKVWDGSAWRSETGTFVDVNGDTMTGALGIIAGTAGSPGLYISGDTNTGIYSPGADQVSVATGGTERLRIDSNGQIEAVSLGTAAAPVFSFTGDPNTGIYSPGADQLALSTNGTGRLFVDSSGRVGVGSTAFASRVTVKNPAVSGEQNIFSVEGATSSATLFSLTTNQTDDTTKFFNIVNGPITFGTNNTERLRITAAGLVGIGTSTPSADGPLTLANAAETPTIFFSRPSAGSYSAAIQAGSFGTLTFYNGASSSTVSGLTARMTIDGQNGRVGIGSTTGFVERLHVNGNIRTDANDTGLFFNSSTTAITGNGTSSYIAFNTSNAEKARLDSSGRFLVGTSSSVGGESIQILNSTTANTLGLYNPTSGTAGAGTTINFRTDGGATGRNQASISGQQENAFVSGGRLVFSTTADGASSPTERMRIQSDGVVKIAGDTWTLSRTYIGTSGSFNSSIGTSSAGTGSTTLYIGNAAIQVSSDARLKENIEDTSLNALDAISQIKVKDFTWNDPTDTSFNNRNARGKWTGLIAQELVEVLPFVVNAPRKEEDGSIDYDSENLWTLDQSQLCPVLIKAVQQQQEIISSLEARIAALESA